MRYCIFHNSDLDGKCGGAIVRKKYPDVELIGLNYGDDFSTKIFNEGDMVIIVDFSLPVDQMRIVNNRCELVWLDHHRTAILDMADAEIVCGGRRDESLAGCEIAWKFFFPEKQMPVAVRMLGEYDTWRWKDLPNSQEILAFQSAMRISSMWPDDPAWDDYLDDVTEAVSRKIDVGMSILNYQQQMMDSMYSSCWKTEWKGYDWLVCNSHQASSSYFEKHPEWENVDGLIVFSQRGPHLFVYSLRHGGRESDLVCGEIAREYGGGGHPGAAGFGSQTSMF